MRALAATGMALTAVMQIAFLLTAGDRPVAYGVLQAVGLAASAVAVLGVLHLHRPHGPLAMAVAFGVHLLVRIAMTGTGLSRLPLPLNALLVAGFLLGTVSAARWTVSGREAQAAGVRAAAWILGVALFLAAARALSRGSLVAAAALLSGSVGFLLVAPYLETSAGAPAPREA